MKIVSRKAAKSAKEQGALNRAVSLAVRIIRIFSVLMRNAYLKNFAPLRSLREATLLFR